MKKRMGTAFLILALLLAGCGAAEPTAADRGAPTHQAETGGTVEADAGAAPDVENNGGSYVRVDGKVYFRRYGPEALGKTTLFGAFLDDYNVTGYPSEIAAYDLVTRQVTPVFQESGCGGLYYVDGGFCLQEVVNGGRAVVWYSLDGAESRTIAEGTLLGVTDSGLTAVRQTAGEEDTFSLYRDGERTDVFSSNQNVLYAGLTDDGLFLLRCDGGDDDWVTWSLWQLPADADGEWIGLGTLPETDPMFGAEPEQFLTADGRIGLAVGYYAGTGHFLNDYALVEAVPGQADSLTEIPAEPVEAEDWRMPRLVVDEAGNIVSADAAPGDLAIVWEGEQYGALQLYDGFQWETLKEGLIPESVDGNCFGREVQTMEYLDGSVYMTLADTCRSPLDDIGWREACALVDMVYLTIPASQGPEQELAFVDHGSILQGNAWYTEDAEGQPCILWQQTTFDAGAWDSESSAAYRIRVAPDAEFDGGEAAFYADMVHVPPEELGEPDYYGYPLPEEPGEFLCFRLNRDGGAAYLTRKSPDALLSITPAPDGADFPEVSDRIEIAPRPSDEDTPWYWAKLTALEDGVRVRLERTADEPGGAAEQARLEGLFLPGSVLLDRTMNRGESVAVRVSYPWHPELRVSVIRNGTCGAYVFGEDNYLHNGPPDGVFTEGILAGYPDDAADALTGDWVCRDPSTGGCAAVVRIDPEHNVVISLEEHTYWFSAECDRLYAESWEAEDLLHLSTWDPGVLDALADAGLSGTDMGDYWFQRYDTDGETILHLAQANNGDAALDALIPGGELWRGAFTLHRFQGAARPAPPPRDAVLTAVVVKAEEAGIWMRTAEQADAWEDGTPVYRARPDAACVFSPTASPEVLAPLDNCRDPAYPMTVFRVTLDRDGTVTALETPEGMG